MTVSSGFGKNTNCWEISKQITRLGMTISITIGCVVAVLCSPMGADMLPVDGGDGFLQPPSSPCLSAPIQDRHSSWRCEVTALLTAARSRAAGPGTACPGGQILPFVGAVTLSQASLKELTSCPGGEMVVVKCLCGRGGKCCPLTIPWGWVSPSCEFRQRFSTREYQVFGYSF